MSVREQTLPSGHSEVVKGSITDAILDLLELGNETEIWKSR